MNKEKFIIRQKQDIRNLQILIQVFNEIKPIIQSFDNKVYNKRLKTALDTVIVDKYVILDTVLSYPQVFIHFDKQNNGIFKWYFKAFVKEQTVDANVRIDAIKTIAEIDKEISTMKQLVEDKKVWLANADIYEQKEKEILQAIKEYKRTVPLSISSNILISDSEY